MIKGSKVSNATSAAKLTANSIQETTPKHISAT
jgi:hypothetical protein